MNENFIDKPYIITYSNHFEFNGKILAFRKKVLFDLTNGNPNALFTSSNNGSFGYWINRKWLSESMIKSIIINKPKQVDISHLQWYLQENLNHVFNLCN